MALRVEEIERGMKPFDHIWCPVCGGQEFVELAPAGGVWCEECNAHFSCRATGGDSGLVIDCRVDDVHNIHKWNGEERKYRDVLRDWLLRVGRLREGVADRLGHSGPQSLAEFVDLIGYGGDKSWPLMFTQVCKEPQGDGSWTDVRGWMGYGIGGKVELRGVMTDYLPACLAKVARRDWALDAARSRLERRGWVVSPEADGRLTACRGSARVIEAEWNGSRVCWSPAGIAPKADTLFA
jgi:hypothetical protein